MANPPAAGRTWDPWTSFNCSKEQYEVAMKRKAVHEQRKVDFQRMIENPKIHTGQGGTQFDPALQRWYSARMTFTKTYDHSRNSIWSIGLFYILPVALLTWGMHKDRQNREESIKKGETRTVHKLFKTHF